MCSSDLVLTSDADTRRFRKGHRTGEGPVLAVVQPGSLLEQWQALQAAVQAGRIVINLLPEQSYQLDAGYEYSTSKWNISATPFVSYFSNYIFLDPTGEWSILPHSGQIYRYRQAKVWLGGGELSARYSFNAYWSASASIDYIYNLNITDGYPLPTQIGRASCRERV